MVQLAEWSLPTQGSAVQIQFFFNLKFVIPFIPIIELIQKDDVLAYFRSSNLNLNHSTTDF